MTTNVEAVLQQARAYLAAHEPPAVDRTELSYKTLQLDQRTAAEHKSIERFLGRADDVERQASVEILEFPC